ncbi:unnamed protein product [Oppiella nova]|uniref:Phospholipid scramblase n=1 Tax=Oppiella nova TaxID=334625 RepID=A0A7R9MIA3_9ACAR|nr:unnamed protein product [Oppiella nova]CAG2177910.1 unnamed protein product [Oppiella nova]
MTAQSPQHIPKPTTLRPVNCPPGLEYLLQVDQLIVKQKVEILETFTGFETNNEYDIQNNLGQNVYLASEDTDCCTRNCCGPNRAFNMRIVGPSNREVLHLVRPLRCDTCFCFCCLQYMRVEAPVGHLIGYVVQDCSYDENLWTRLCQDVEFDVLAKDTNTAIGRITKRWSAILRETFTDADIYGVLFPSDMDVRAKACLLAATLLIDYMFFEKKGSQERERERERERETGRGC